MHWEHRHLDGKGGQESYEEPNLECGLNCLVGELFEVQGAERVVQRDHTNQHQDAAGQRKEQELDRGVDSRRATPNTNDEEHGNDHQFPENKKEKKICRGEQPDHCRLGDQ